MYFLSYKQNGSQLSLKNILANMAKKARERLISSHLSRCNLNELPQHSTGVEGRGGASGS